MESTPRFIENIDWITILIFGSLLFVILAKGLFYTRFLNFIILPFNNKYVIMYNKKEKLINWFHIFLSCFQIINFSVLAYFIVKIFSDPAQLKISPIFFPIILSGLILFLLTKSILQLSNAFVFGSHQIISEIIFKKLSYLNYSGILMFIANIILAYVVTDSKLVVFTVLSLILLVNIIGWFMILKNYQKFIASNIIYFILYLCALEISPIIIIANVIKQ